MLTRTFKKKNPARKSENTGFPGSGVPHPPRDPPEPKPSTRQKYNVFKVGKGSMRDQRGIFSETISTLKFQVKASLIPVK